MKKIFLLVIIWGFALSMLAQPVFQYPQNAPEIGDIMEIQFVAPNGLNPAPNGANVNWNFSQLTNIGDPGQISVISPASAPSGNEFPMANVVLNMNDSIYTYGKIENDGFEYHGSKATISGFDIVLVFNDYKEYMRYPFPFGAAFTDTYRGASTALTAQITASGTTSVMYDAYGTLTLPNGTYTDVMRTMTTDVEVDSIFSGGFLVKTILTTRLQYSWYTTTSFGPVFSMEIMDAGGMIDTVCYYTTSGSWIEPQDTQQFAQLRTFPNPAGNYLTVAFTSSCTGPVNIRIVNQVGQTMIDHLLTEPLNGEVSQKIDIGSLPAGIYFLGILCNGAHQLTGKFIVK